MTKVKYAQYTELKFLQANKASSEKNLIIQIKNKIIYSAA